METAPGKALALPITVEILVDGSNHGGQNLNVLSFYSPEVRKACFGPPQLQRESHHRISEAGTPFTEEHQEATL